VGILPRSYGQCGSVVEKCPVGDRIAPEDVNRASDSDEASLGD